MSDLETSAPSVEPNTQEQNGEQSNEENTELLAGEKPTNQTEVQKLLKKFKLKVDGQEYEEEVDLNDVDRMTRALQMEAVGRKRLSELQDEKRKVYELANLFDKDPKSLLKKLGDNGIKAAEELLLEQYQKQQMTPEQLELMELRSKLQAIEDEKKAIAEEQEKQKQIEVETKVANDLQKQIIDALNETGIKSPSPQHIKDMAYLMQQNLKLGLDLNTKDLAAHYLSTHDENVQKRTEGMTGERIYKMLGKQGIKELNQYMIEQAKSKQKGFAKQQHEMRMPSPKPDTDDRMTPDQWLKMQREKIKNMRD